MIMNTVIAMKFALIIFASIGHSETVSSTTAEFSTRSLCMAAKTRVENTIKSKLYGVKVAAMCVQKF